MCTLAVVWLDGTISLSNTKELFHHIRFMMQTIYGMKIRLLDKQVTSLSKGERVNVSIMAEFVGLFHVLWFLKCPMTSSAPTLQLQSIMQMRRYRKHRPKVSDLLLDSMKKHLWHITEESVVTALADEDLESEERRDLGLALFKIRRPDQFDPKQPEFPDVFDSQLHPDRLWMSGQVPQLKHFVGPRSWLLFSKLELSEFDCEWLQLDPAVWKLMSGYQRFREFISNTTNVNDSAERGVALAADFRGSFEQENVCQDNLVTVAESRKLVPRDSKQSVKAQQMRKICGI